MCGRFSLDRLPSNIVEALIDAEFSIQTRPEVFPSNQVPVVFRGENGNELTKMTWGWIREWPDKKTGKMKKTNLINFRALEAWNKPTWRKAIHERRCIVPASAFFEWDENQPQKQRDKYRIDPAFDDGFAFGGVYEINSETGEMFVSIGTTNPNVQMAKIHHRMPVILDKEEFNNWFELEDRDEIDHLMQPVNDDWITLTKET